MTAAPRPRGRPRQLYCKRGHDLSVHGKPNSGGGRYCSACEAGRERNRAEYRRNYFQRKKADLEWYAARKLRINAARRKKDRS